MIACIVIAGIISLLSIFVFFGDAFSNTGGSVVPNMFHLMFGGNQTVNGYIIVWKRYDALTFLFVVQIIIMIMAIVAFCICYKIATDPYAEATAGKVISVIMAILSVVALITSFCTLQITNINTSSYSDVKLGFGPVFYSILHIITGIILIIGIGLQFKEENAYLYSRSHTTHRTTSTYNRPTSSYTSTSSSQSSKPAQPSQQKPVLSENEKVDLILKYKKMLDEGVITQEEFDKKKKELLS